MLAGIVYGNGRAGVYHGRVHSQCTQILLMHRECWFHVLLCLLLEADPVGMSILNRVTLISSQHAFKR